MRYVGDHTYIPRDPARFLRRKDNGKKDNGKPAYRHRICDARHFPRECAEVDRFTHPTEEVRGPPRMRSVTAWRANHRKYVRFCGFLLPPPKS